MERDTKRPTASNPLRNERWFEDVFRRYHAAVRAYVARRAPVDSDDVVAEVFAIAWRKRDQVPEHALPWLYGVAAREVLHSLREDRKRGALHVRLASHGDVIAPDRTVEVDDRVTAQGPVQQALSRLPAVDVEVLRLWAWEHLEPNEIATVLQISTVAARVRLHRARKRFESALAAGAHPPAEADPPQTLRTCTLPATLATREYSHE